jgi:DNA repair protein RecO (recombination protein O)
MRELRTEAVVLKRINYGEADRILTLITPLGKKSAVAKGVRKERSKLAGAVEPFTLTEINLHEGKSELLIVTGAKAKKFYSDLLKDLNRLEVASEILKRISRASDFVDSPEHFELTRQCLETLNAGGNMEVVLAWFYLNLARVSGEEINLRFDINGEPLVADSCYVWDSMEKAMRKDMKGELGANEIKMLRLMVSAKLALILRVKEVGEMAAELLYIAKTLNQI